MKSVALTSTEKLTRTLDKSPRQLSRVVAWELRRFCASRPFWLQALGFLCFSFFLTWAQGTPDSFRLAGSRDTFGDILHQRVEPNLQKPDDHHGGDRSCCPPFDHSRYDGNRKLSCD